MESTNVVAGITAECMHQHDWTKLKASLSKQAQLTFVDGMNTSFDRQSNESVMVIPEDVAS